MGWAWQRWRRPWPKAGCRTFFVATLDEGIALRKLATDAAIYVLNGLHLPIRGTSAEHKLRPALCGLGEIERWSERFVNDGKSAKDLPVPAPALHFDTGISRLGIPRDETRRLIAEPGLVRRSEAGAADELPRLLRRYRVADERAAAAALQRDLRGLKRCRRRRRAPSPPPAASSWGALSSGNWCAPGPRSTASRRSPTSPTRCGKWFGCKRKSCRSGALTMVTPLAMVRPTDSTRPARLATIGVGYADGICAPSPIAASPISAAPSAHRRARLHGSPDDRCERHCPEAAAQSGASVDLSARSRSPDELGAPRPAPSATRC